MFKDALRKRRQAQTMIDEYMKRNSFAFKALAAHTERLRKMVADADASPLGHDAVAIRAEVARIVDAELPMSTGVSNTERASVTLTTEDREYIVNSITREITGWLTKTEASKPLVKVPPGTRWEDLSLTFQGDDGIAVSYKDRILGAYTRSQLGFVKSKTRDQDPDVLWELLHILAICNELKHPPTKDGLRHNWGTNAPTENSIEKRKSKLAAKLRTVFGIHDDPFLPYNRSQGYRTKFTLRPEAELRNSGELHASGIAYDDDKYSEEDDLN